ncbi:MAG: hypothetical protein GVY18_08315 [Bacteroidetes bacterium]|jgi:hypothetical protein|nr:hypothetical protein [Bacteroidota bacterium]
MTNRRSVLLIYLLALALFTFASGCELLGIGADDVRVTTNRTSYTVGPSERIQLTVRNNLDDTIYYVCTGKVYLHELDKDRVINSRQVHGFEECLARSPIEPGASQSFEIAFDYIDDFRFDETVRYRLVIDLYEDIDFKRPLDETDRRSNTFRITRRSS